MPEARKEAVPQIGLIPDDQDLVPLLCACTDEELDPCVRIILEKGWISSELDYTEGYKTHAPHHSKYAREIAAEIQLYGGNTLPNIVRGHGVRYREVVYDVGRKVKAGVNEDDSVEGMEGKLIAKLLVDAWDKMTDEQKRAMLESIGERAKGAKAAQIPNQQVFAALLQAGIKAGGFQSYVLALQVANGVTKAVLGRGLAFAANAALTRYMAVLAGPIGWVLTSVWLLLDIAGPAFRVTTPIVLLVAYLRLKFKMERAGFLLCGRSGHGKSSLLNALSGQQIATVGHVRPESPTWMGHEITFRDRYLINVIDTRGIFESTTPKGALSEDALKELKASMIRHNPGVVIHVMSAPEARNMSEDLMALGGGMHELSSTLGVRPVKVLAISKADILDNPRQWPGRESYRKLADLLRYLGDEVMGDSRCRPLVARSPELGLALSGENKHDYKYIIPLCCRAEEDLWNMNTFLDVSESLIKELKLGRGA